jgi:hypothetical protein
MYDSWQGKTDIGLWEVGCYVMAGKQLLSHQYRLPFDKMHLMIYKILDTIS